MVKKTKAKEAKAETQVAHIGNRQISIMWWIIALIVIDAITYLVVGKEPGVYRYVLDILTITFSTLAVIAAGMVYFGIEGTFEDEKKTFLFIGICFLFRLIAELVWIYLDVSGIELGYLSLADAFWYLSYLFIFIGLAYKIKKTFIFDKGKIIAGVFAIAAVIIAIFGYGVWEEVIGASQAEAIAQILLELYVVFDILIVALLAVLIIPMMLAYNKTFKSYLMIALGFVVFAIYDFLYAELALTGGYYVGNPLDILWDSAYVLIFGGLLLKYFFLKGEVGDD